MCHGFLGSTLGATRAAAAWRGKEERVESYRTEVVVRFLCFWGGFWLVFFLQKKVKMKK